MNEEVTTNRTETHVLAIISLVLSVLGLFWVLPLVGAIGGIITGYIARREIRSQPTRYTGDGIAKAGIILGWIGLAVLFLGVCGILLFVFPLRVSSGAMELAPQFILP